MPSISPTQSNAQAALTAFLNAVLPGLPGSAPAVVVGTISGTTLTVTAVKQGSLQPNAPLLGLGVAPGTQVVKVLQPGPGGTGDYQVSVAQTLAQTTMATGVSVVAGQANRVPEPVNPYFAVFTPMRFERIETNFDGWADVQFQGSIADGVLTVTEVAFGQVLPGATVFGTGVSVGTAVIGQISGVDGGPGTYSISPTQAAPAQTMASGAMEITMGSIATIQCDFHSPDTLAGDFAEIFSTLLRDQFGTDFFANLGPPLNGVTPLYADDPAQRPFTNAEALWEWRWSLDVKLQVNQVVSVPQRFFTSAIVVPESVDVEFPL